MLLTRSAPEASAWEATVLSTAHRLRSSRDFSEVVRRGRRAGRPRLTLHVLATQAQDTPRAGLVVSKAVGNAVVRHQVSRRLRHLLRDRVPALPSGTLVVVRASPQAGSATSAELAADLDGAFRKLVA